MDADAGLGAAADIDGHAEQLEIRGLERQQQTARIADPVAIAERDRPVARRGLVQLLVEAGQHGVDQRRGDGGVLSRGSGLGLGCFDDDAVAFDVDDDDVCALFNHFSFGDDGVSLVVDEGESGDRHTCGEEE